MNTCPLEPEPVDTSERASALGGSSPHLPVVPTVRHPTQEGHRFPDCMKSAPWQTTRKEAGIGREGEPPQERLNL